MSPAPLPPDEGDRLEALRLYRVLDTGAEQVFDDLTLLAAEICGTPISLVSLVDSDRQWFKSKVGLNVTETTRDIAFCAHAILQRDVFVVPDAAADQRFSDNPLVLEEPRIRFYAGAPLRSPEGLPIGTLCVIDRTPRRLEPRQVEALRILGRLVMAHLESRRLLADATEMAERRREAAASAAAGDPASRRALLRHTVATLAYRGGKALRGAPEGFASFRLREGTRTPGEILAHVGDLLDWAIWLGRGEKRWEDSPALPWDQGTVRFFDGLARLDAFLASGEPLAADPEKLFQGPIADAFTHVGQISLLRRLADGPVRGENYFRAEIEAGRVGAEQAAPKREFG